MDFGKKPIILIIAPHSNCDPNADHRMCDLRAKDAAEKINELVQKTHEVKLFLSDVYRKIHDYNRKESFNTQWRQNIRNYIEAHRDSRIIVFEVHSYPNKDTEFAIGSEMALLAIDEYLCETQELKEHLENAGIKVHKKINGIRINNLMMDTKEYNNIQAHYLLEFNEDYDALTNDRSNKAIGTIFTKSLFNKCSRFVKVNYFTIKYFVLIIIILILLYFIYDKKNINHTRHLSNRYNKVNWI
jgi:hypothetical protein